VPVASRSKRSTSDTVAPQGGGSTAQIGAYVTRIDEADDPRRRLLIKALAAGLFSGGVTLTGGLAAQVAGGRPAKLPPGVSVYRSSGIATVNDRPVAADTAVFLRRGCSWGGGLKLTDASQRVSLGAYGTGDAPTLTGDGVGRDFPVVDVEAEGVMLSGLHIRNAEAVGLKLSAADVTVDGLEIDDVAFGVTVQGPRATITRTAVHDLHLLINTPGGSDDTGAVGFDVQADDVSITASSCTNCRAPSYDFGHDGGFAEIYNHGDRLRLIGNTARNVQGILEIGGVVDDGGAHDVVLENNTFSETFGGIWIHQKDEFSIPVGTVTLRGNTIVNSAKGVTMGGKVGALVLQDNTIAVPGNVSTGGEPAEHTGNHYYLTRPALLGFRAHGTETISTYDSYPR